MDADRGIDTRLDATRKRTQGEGHDNAVLFGGVEAPEDSQHEATPLITKSSRDGEDDPEADGDGYVPWSGEHDYDGLPWWKKPSVSTLNSYGVGKMRHIANKS
jgi:hypothetical protein